MLLYLLLLILPTNKEIVFKDKVDLIEYNHYHDREMKHVFDQLIFYYWSSQKKRHEVIAWRLVKSESQIPRKHKDYWVAIWHDDGTLREVKANYFRETWTQYDPEVLERKYLPQDQRLELKYKDI